MFNDFIPRKSKHFANTRNLIKSNLMYDDNFRTKDMDPKHEYRYSQGIDVFFFHVPFLATLKFP